MFREIGGQFVHTVAYGVGDQAILGITGSFGTTDIWQQPFELLSRRYRTIAYDHYGTGLTHVSEDLVTFENQVRLVGDVLDAFEVERAIIAGDSSMIAVAVEFAARAPERVSALVLASGTLDFAPRETTLRFVRGLRADFDATLDFFVRLCLPEDERGHLRAWLRAIIARTGGERAARLVESFHDVDVRDRLPVITAPTLVIHGDLDRVGGHDVAAAEQIAQAIPGAHLHVLEGAGHVPTLSRPAEVAGVIEAFLRSLE